MLPTKKDLKEYANCDNLRFVVHEKQAKSNKFVIRLEKDGVLNCWTLPSGMPEKASEKCIAVTDSECKTQMLYFDGEQEGANKTPAKLSIKDYGKYEILLWDDLKIEILLEGKEFYGRYILVKFEKAGPKTWLIMKAK
ncbi:ATP-dependent DNA ligase [Methanomicrobium antiquum]|uniref:ATP-dependent DNA ligase n=1 Tax=Methanomicrobium antiquum TaxID=487686 RepID=A0AAF0JN10_9EURY|nr:DNA polymerase ligase N-terminal domain-containing protein [Methanomicrobium antiquum]MDD3977816.1 DNA polymerase ligase N-terminal domain-containing protein [Methanomicrobium sp.]WFN36971.1 ATP-dependent DNA ligase [Methanomicrobium antiquum]